MVSIESAERASAERGREVGRSREREVNWREKVSDGEGPGRAKYGASMRGAAVVVAFSAECCAGGGSDPSHSISYPLDFVQ